MSRILRHVKNWKNIVLLTIIVVLAVMFAVNLIHFKDGISSGLDQSKTYELSDMESALRNEMYPLLLHMVKSNRFAEYGTVIDTGEYERFSDFASAYIYSDIYEKTGNTRLATDYRKKAADAGSTLTSYRFQKAAEKVKDMCRRLSELGIQP